MPTITLEWDAQDLQFWKDARLEQALFQALSKAGGDAVRFLKSGSSKIIRGRKRFKVARVNKSMNLNYPRGVRSIDELEWRMDVSSAPMPMGDLPSSQVRRGVSVAVNTNGRKVLSQAFIATMRSGHRGVFIRAEGNALGSKANKLGLKPRVGRLPIAEIFTSRITDVFQDQGFMDFIQTGAQEKFAESFDRLLPLELDKVK